MRKIKYNPTRIQKRTDCFWCRSTMFLDHHEFLCGPDRKNAAEDGLWVWACRRCHIRIQNDPEIMLNGKKLSQQIFEEEIGTRDDFRKRYRKSYL